jgi:hypothetical protein
LYYHVQNCNSAIHVYTKVILPYMFITTLTLLKYGSELMYSWRVTKTFLIYYHISKVREWTHVLMKDKKFLIYYHISKVRGWTHVLMKGKTFLIYYHISKVRGWTHVLMKGKKFLIYYHISKAIFRSKLQDSVNYSKRTRYDEQFGNQIEKLSK